MNRLFGNFFKITSVICGILSLDAYAAPKNPIFSNPAAEYIFSNTGVNIGFTAFSERSFKVTWTVLDVTNPNAPKSLCSSSLPKPPPLIPISIPYNLNCKIPFSYGESQVQIRTCSGGINPCSTSNIKSIFQYNDAPSSAPRIGTWSPYYFIELFSEYKAGEEIAFDMTFNAIAQYQRPTTLNVWQVGTPDKLLCSNNIGPITAVSHMAPGIGSCKATPVAANATIPTAGLSISVYAQTCNTGTQQCGPKSALSNFKVTKNPWLTLNTASWVTRKNNGPSKTDKNTGTRYDIPYSNNTGKTVAAYYTEWSVYNGRRFYPKDIPVENLTHIYHSFIAICGNNAALLALENENENNGNTGGNPHQVLVDSCTQQGIQNDQVTIHDRDAAINNNNAGWINGGKLDPSETTNDVVRGIFGEYYRMKMTFPHIRILPSVGGGTMSDPLFELAKDPARRKVFITSAINFINKHDFFDGIDLDWEFPVVGGATSGIATADDAQAYVDLTRELRLHLDDLGRKKNRYYELHATFGGAPSFIEQLLLAEMDIVPFYLPSRNSIDHFNFMTYDYYGAWNNNHGHHAAIMNIGGGTPNDGLSAHELIQKAIAMGVPAHKINIGVAAYARGWDSISGGDVNGPFNGIANGGVPSKGYRDWVSAELLLAQPSGRWAPGVADYKGMERNEMGGPNGTGTNGWQLLSDPVFDAHQYLWNLSTGSLMTLDTAKSTRAKGALVNQYGLGGVIIWSIDGDSGTLLNAVHQGFGNIPK